MWIKIATTTVCEGFTFDGTLPHLSSSSHMHKSSLCSAGGEHGCGQRRVERQRHSHDERAKFWHFEPNSDGLARHGGCVRQYRMDVCDDDCMCAASLRRLDV